MSENIEDKPYLDLPFEEGKFDFGEWVYAHRVALCVTLIFYLLLAILFVAAKITLVTSRVERVMAIDLQQLAELERRRDELKKSVEELQRQETMDWAKVQNVASNENAQSSEVRDDRNTDVEELLRDAAEFQERMAANRAAYESGVAEAKAIKERKPKVEEKPQNESQRRDANVKGNVTVSYSFNDPVRHSQRLSVPAYQCEGGGEVVVQVAIGVSGEVISAKVTRGGDDCMQQTAISAARASKFNYDKSAPSKQVGTITYIFVPQ